MTNETTAAPGVLTDEQIARAWFGEEYGRGHDRAPGYVYTFLAALAAQPSQAQAGVAVSKWVPVEPTEEMVIAANDVEHCEEGITRGQLRAAIAAAPASPVASNEREGMTPEWLWAQLMDWCKKVGRAPATAPELFEIVGRARALLAARTGGANE